MKPVSCRKIAAELGEDWSGHRKGLCWFRSEIQWCFLRFVVNVNWVLGEDCRRPGVRCCVQQVLVETLASIQECGRGLVCHNHCDSFLDS